MKYSKATNYALHIVLYMIKYDKNDNLSLQPLANNFNISASYLSKILTQLVKAGIIQSASGVNGGYSLSKKKDDISFLDIIKATEGTGALFNCDLQEDNNCPIDKVMAEAEDVMGKYLQNKKLYEVIEKHHHNSKETHQLERKIQFLDGVERRTEFPPEEVLQMLAIKKTDNILDLGAGTGYLTIPAAQMVQGLVYALDMDEKMLEIIDCKAKDESITNIKLVKGIIDNIPLPDDSIDIVLASLVLHEIKPLATTLQQINRVLKNSGQFMCLEYEKDESAIEGPPMQIRVASSVMEQELKNAGLNITQKIFLRKNIYIITAKK